MTGTRLVAAVAMRLVQDAAIPEHVQETTTADRMSTDRLLEDRAHGEIRPKPMRRCCRMTKLEAMSVMLQPTRNQGLDYHNLVIAQAMDGKTDCEAKPQAEVGSCLIPGD
jgi:hypothetical protein